MKHLFLGIVLSLISSWAFSQDITGKWLTEDEEAIVEIFKSGDVINGKIVWLKNPNDQYGKLLRDVENPDQYKRSQPVVGLLMLTDFKQNKEKWTNGKIYDPSEGKTYKSTIWIENGKLKVRGYVGVFFQTQTWTKK